MTFYKQDSVNDIPEVKTKLIVEQKFDVKIEVKQPWLPPEATYQEPLSKTMQNLKNKIEQNTAYRNNVTSMLKMRS